MKHIVIFLTFIFFVSCAEQKNYISKIEGKKIPVTEKILQNNYIDNFIKPYRDKIDQDMSEVLAINPETLDKSGAWQSNIGNLISDVTLQRGNLVYNKRFNKNIDICMLNHGGIRSILPKGNVTMRTAFQIMPFENTLFVMELKGEQILEMIKYIIAEKKPHPLSGLTFTIDKNKMPTNILVQGKQLELEQIYNVATSDYLSNGGDKMDFFKKNVGSHDLGYKLRNVLIDYFKEVEIISVNKTPRISVE